MYMGIYYKNGISTQVGKCKYAIDNIKTTRIAI